MKAKSELDANIPQELPEYESYDIEMHNLPVFPFHESKKYDILNPIFLSTKGLEHMRENFQREFFDMFGLVYKPYPYLFGYHPMIFG